MTTMRAIFRVPFRLFLITMTAGAAGAAEPSPAQIGRADKVAASLSLGDQGKQARVGHLIAAFQADLDELQTSVKGGDGKSGTLDDRQAKLKQDFLGQLARELSPEEIEKVKNGLTYNVLPITFAVYQEMLPDLEEPRKQQILAWLTEARDLAITAGSSDKKHECFRKYKGRINNYLSQHGIDMKKAEHDLAARRKKAAEGNR